MTDRVIFFPLFCNLGDRRKEVTLWAAVCQQRI